MNKCAVRWKFLVCGSAQRISKCNVSRRLLFSSATPWQFYSICWKTVLVPNQFWVVFWFFGTKSFDKTHKLAWMLILDYFRLNILPGIVNTAYFLLVIFCHSIVQLPVAWFYLQLFQVVNDIIITWHFCKCPICLLAFVFLFWASWSSCFEVLCNTNLCRIISVVSTLPLKSVLFFHPCLLTLAYLFLKVRPPFPGGGGEGPPKPLHLFSVLLSFSYTIPISLLLLF